MYVCMTKVISISDEAYNALRKIDANKSFTEVIIELTFEKRKKSLLEFAGIWDDTFAENFKKEIYEDRKRPSRRFK